MAEYSITAGSVPINTGYPADVQGLLNLLSSYLTVLSPDNLKNYVLDYNTPIASNQDKVWFQTNSLADASPKSINVYADGRWQEFTPFTFGDIILVTASATISSPWGVGSTSYTVSGVGSVTTPSTPEPPIGLKYKVYVGRYS
jgi:hypothetical protein